MDVTVWRRYSEFQIMRTFLGEKFPAVRCIDGKH